ncbi:MAG TPA: DUF5329 domain-containing protein [Spirochaetota bacterium]|nr:DUF5329 domain-containing protein [Spirochaetota bacterium]
MNKPLACLAFAIALAALIPPHHSGAADIDPLERGRIHSLLNALERSGFAFIRNGASYTAREARAHLKMKLDRAGGRVKTAEQFIDYCATRSSSTGRPYLVRLPDGSTVEAGKWLRTRLAEIDVKNTDGAEKAP